MDLWFYSNARIKPLAADVSAFTTPLKLLGYSITPTLAIEKLLTVFRAKIVLFHFRFK